MVGGRGRSDTGVRREVTLSALTLLATSPLTPRSAQWPVSYLCPTSLGTPHFRTRTPGGLRTSSRKSPVCWPGRQGWWRLAPCGAVHGADPSVWRLGAPGREGVSGRLVLGARGCPVSLWFPCLPKVPSRPGGGMQSQTNHVSTGKSHVLCAVTQDCFDVWKSACDGACGRLNHVQCAFKY